MDLEAQELLTSLAVTSPNGRGYALEHGQIKYQGRIWIGANLALCSKLTSNFHETMIGEHSGILATYHCIKKLYSLKMWLNYMAYRVPLCLIGIKCSQAHSGVSSFKQLALNCTTTQLIIHKPAGKRKGSTSVWKCTFIVSFIIVLRNGSLG